VPEAYLLDGAKVMNKETMKRVDQNPALHDRKGTEKKPKKRKSNRLLRKPGQKLRNGGREK